MIRILKKYPFFLFLLPLFVVVHLEKELHQVIQYKLVYDKIIILFIAPVIAYFISLLILRNRVKASIFSFVILVLFYFTGEIKNLLHQSLHRSFWQSYRLLFIIELLLLSVTFFWLKRSTPSKSKIFLPINTLLIFFLLADIAGIFLNSNNTKYAAADNAELVNHGCTDTCKPDIYYLVADAYASPEMLLSEYNYPNEDFESNLLTKGFHIIPDSKSNYNYTAYSLAGTLNLNYLNYADTVRKVSDRQYLQYLRTVRDNRLITFLEKEKYAIYNHSLFEFEKHSSTIRSIDFWGFRELYDQYNLVNKFYLDAGHAFPEKIKNIFYNKYFVNSRENKKAVDSIAYHQLLQTAKTANKRPKFVYTHFLRPHPPFLFDSSGNTLKKNVSLKEAYIHKIAAVNQMLKNATDSIIHYSNRPLVIIIQGDHGYVTYEEKKTPELLSNFCAFYFSDKNYEQIPEKFTNVNTFRVVLNKYFGSGLEMLPDKFYLIK